jgi:hypothetical protein
MTHSTDHDCTIFFPAIVKYLTSLSGGLATNLEIRLDDTKNFLVAVKIESPLRSATL